MTASEPAILVRGMRADDIDRIFMIAWSRKHAPKWTKAAYFSALKAETPCHAELPWWPRTRARTTLPCWWTGRPQALSRPGAPPPWRKKQRMAVWSGSIADLVTQAELETIAIAAAEQRRGIGRKLMTAMAEELSAAAVSEALLEVRASNEKALGLYRSMGWLETGRRPRYYAEPEEDAFRQLHESGARVTHTAVIPHGTGPTLQKPTRCREKINPAADCPQTGHSIVITVTQGPLLTRNSQGQVTFVDFLACELSTYGDICKCSLTIGGA